MKKPLKTILVALTLLPAAVFAAKTQSSAAKKSPYCDEIKKPPTGEYACKARNVWKSIGSNSKGKQIPLAQKKVLTPAAYDEWKRLDNPVMSNDGRWIAYT